MYTVHNIHKQRHRKTIATNCQQRRTHTHTHIHAQYAHSNECKVQTCSDFNVLNGLLLYSTFPSFYCIAHSRHNAGSIYIGRVTQYTSVCDCARACECVRSVIETDCRIQVFVCLYRYSTG